MLLNFCKERARCWDRGTEVRVHALWQKGLLGGIDGRDHDDDLYMYGGVRVQYI